MAKTTTKIAMMMVLAIGLMASAATAQNKDGGFAPVGIYTGIETSAGTFESMSAMRYGNRYVLNSSGERESRHLTVSLNYLMSGPAPLQGFSVISGNWSLVVIRNNQYAGTLYGEVTGGAITFIENANGETTSKQIQINLQGTGGLGMFAGKESENISGVYQAITDLRSKETNGNASFNF